MVSAREAGRQCERGERHGEGEAARMCHCEKKIQKKKEAKINNSLMCLPVSSFTFCVRACLCCVVVSKEGHGPGGWPEIQAS